MSWDTCLTSVGPLPSQSVRDSILKSPTPPRRFTVSRTPRVTNVVRMLIPPEDLAAEDLQAQRARQAELGGRRLDAGAGAGLAARVPAHHSVQSEPAAGPDAASLRAPALQTADDTASPLPRSHHDSDASTSTVVVAGGASADAASAYHARERDPADDVPVAAWWDPLDGRKVCLVREAFHVGYRRDALAKPQCRDAQISRLRAWLEPRLGGACGGSCYVSGPPGTGKSLTVLGLLHQAIGPEVGETRPAVVEVNCMRIGSRAQLLGAVVRGLQDAVARGASADGVSLALRAPDASPDGSCAGSLQTLRAAVLGPGARPVVLVLDEFDGLLDGSLSDRYLVEDLFVLAHAPGSRLTVVGIANSIDLVQRLLQPGGPFYRRGLRPEHITFPSYGAEALGLLLQQRALELPGPVFEPRALELCARKVAGGTGDMRLALEAAGRAVEIAVDRALDAALETGTSMGTSTSTSLVSLRDVAAALSALTGGVGLASASAVAMRGLPPPQQALLAAAAIESVGKGRAGETMAATTASMATFSVGALAVAHAKLVCEVGTAGYGTTELLAVAETLADQGLLTLGPRRGPDTQRRVTMRVSASDVRRAMVDVPVIGAALDRALRGPRVSTGGDW